MKCFLSHSSSDKASYVRIVAEKLRPNMIVYDDDTFEAGMPNSKEILKGLDETDIFVLFISKAALNSTWVRKEIFEAYARLSRGDIERIYPIIIDDEVTHDHRQIPDWMRDEYNLRLVAQPTAAVRRIEQRLRELSWKRHPKIQEKERIFVGRNDIIKSLEERLDNISKPPTSCLVASGLKKIGRRALLKHALVKTNTIGSSYDPLRIHLTQEDGLEGFIVKINDLGVARYRSVLGLLFREPQEKIEIAISICKEIIKAKDILLIEDDGSIVTYEGALTQWFLDILSQLNCERVLFAVAAMYRLYARHTWDNDSVYSLTIPELSVPERVGLLRRYSELEEIDISRNDLDWISGLLKGYPDQVFFAVDMIKADGLESVKQNSHDIIEFSKNRAAVVLRRYETDQTIIDFLRFLAGFEFISYKLIHDVVDNKKLTTVVLRRFISESICEEIGAMREYIRVNDIIRDYIFRSKWQLPEPYISKLRTFTSDYVSQEKPEVTDASEYFYYVKSALANGQVLDENLLIPAHFLTTMRELYDSRRYNEVIRLCDRVLQSSAVLDAKAEADIRYYLCQALARLRQVRFLNEVQHIDGQEKNFLLGFYYRLQGRYEDAIGKQLQAMKAPRSERRARRELIILYALMEEWDEALVFARDNYNQFPSNPFFVSAYFNCLVQQQPRDRRKELESLIEALDAINSDQAKEMAASARCQLAAIYDGDQANAIKIIDDAIAAFPTNLYPVVTKLDVCVRYRNRIGIESCLNILRMEKSQNKTFYTHLKRGEAILAALNGDLRTAISIAEREFKQHSKRARDRRKRCFQATALSAGATG